MLNKLNVSSRKQNRKQKLIVYIALTVVTLAVFWQVNHYDFVNFDDNLYVTENSAVQTGITLAGFRWAFSTTYYGGWNPPIWLSYMFDYQLHGLNAGGYHLTNLILHILSALLLFWLFTRMTGAIWKSAFVAALFALHPLHVESVAWISERRDVLSAFFWMLTLCLYVYYTEKPVIKRYLPVLFSFFCALTSKPMVVTLPVVMILLDYWPLGRLQSQEATTNLTDVIPLSTNQGKKKNKAKKEALKGNISPPDKRRLSEARIAGIIPLWQLWEKIPFFVLSAVISIMKIYDQYTLWPHQYFPLGSRLANAPVSFVAYLEKTFWPYDLTVFYPFSDKLPLWQVLGATILIFVISVAVIVMAKRLPYLFIGWLWFAITLLPVIGILPIENYAMADRYTYLPSVGIAVMLAWGIPLLFKHEDIRKKILLPASTAFLIIMAVLTWQQCGYWKNGIELWNHALQATKDNYMAYYCRGNFYYGQTKQYQHAIEDYNEVIRLKPDWAPAYVNRGNLYNGLGQYQMAIEDYNTAIGLRPDYAMAYNNRGIVYGELSQYQRAIEDYNTAIGLSPDYADAYSNRALVYFNQRNIFPGCSNARKACALGFCKILKEAKSKGYCH